MGFSDGLQFFVLYLCGLFEAASSCRCWGCRFSCRQFSCSDADNVGPASPGLRYEDYALCLNGKDFLSLCMVLGRLECQFRALCAVVLEAAEQWGALCAPGYPGFHFR